MGSVKRRIMKLEEKTGGDEKVQIVVNWDEEPAEPEPGTIVITWDDEDEEELDDD